MHFTALSKRNEASGTITTISEANVQKITLTASNGVRGTVKLQQDAAQVTLTNTALEVLRVSLLFQVKNVFP